MRLLLLLNLLLCQSLPGQNCPNDSLFNRFKYDVQIEMLNHPNEIRWHDATKESFYTLMIDCPVNCLVKYTSGTKTIFTNNVFTPEIKELIKTMTSGDRIYLEDIRVEFPGKRVGNIGGKLFRIR